MSIGLFLSINMGLEKISTKRSYRPQMAAIPSKNTKPEILVRQFLFARGFRYRIDVHGMPGRPDIVLPRFKTAIFVHGCFWHGHDCRNRGTFRIPKVNETYWVSKIKRNRVRDLLSRSVLERLGWHVAAIWECEVHNRMLLEGKLQALLSAKRFGRQQRLWPKSADWAAMPVNEPPNDTFV